MSNIVFIPNIDLGKSQERQESNTQVYKYSIDSWKSWCDKNDCELLVLEDLLYPINYMKITWQRYYLFDILDANEIDYNQILMVDADTIVHPDCPNFFELTDNKYCGVMNEGDYEWVLRSVRGFVLFLVVWAKCRNVFSRRCDEFLRFFLTLWWILAIFLTTLWWIFCVLYKAFIL